MTTNADIPDIERLTFFTGQPLRAADFAALQGNARALRWLHHRSLHAWGIGLGLGVRGERGDSVVRVDPGYGVDCLGREIVLAEPRTVPIPGGAGDGEVTFYLVASFLDDAGQQVVERRDGACLPGGAVRLTEEPRIDWRRPPQLRDGYDVLLAQAWVRNCRLSRPLSLAVRRDARPGAHPYLAAGQTEEGKTAWTALKAGAVTIGVAATVDTSAARFRGTPRYVAHVAGGRFLAKAPGPLLAVGVPAISRPTAESFRIEVPLPPLAAKLFNPPALRSEKAAPGIVREQLGWHVVWMGIED